MPQRFAHIREELSVIAHSYRARVRRVSKLLKEERVGAALLLSAAPSANRSREMHYPYRQHGDFYYLTGARNKDCALLISSDAPPLVIARPDDAARVLWEGSSESLRDVAERCGAELVACEDPASECRKRLRNHEMLFFQNIPGSIAWKVAESLIALPSWQRGAYPRRFLHSDVLLEPLRSIKDRAEIACIEKAVEITLAGLRGMLPLVGRGASECELGAALDYGFRRQGAEPAFASIVAAGRSAAVLHYESLERSLGPNDLLLVDCGAEYEMYAADVTRVFPAQRRFTGVHREVYEIVLAAQEAALAKVRHGVRVDAIYSAAARVLTEGLKDLGVLRGKTSKLIETEAYRPYFPHSIGHTLGLDVHDIGRMRGERAVTLREGMVITIEPGLYFPKRAGRVPSCGVRIEDDVVVTRTGARVLTKAIPKTPEAVEEWMNF